MQTNVVTNQPMITTTVPTAVKGDHFLTLSIVLIVFCSMLQLYILLPCAIIALVFALLVRSILHVPMCI